jgi:hypothetical protein
VNPSPKNLPAPESDSESTEELLLQAALASQMHRAKSEAKAQERQRPRSREELKAVILAFLRTLPDAPGGGACG